MMFIDCQIQTEFELNIYFENNNTLESLDKCIVQTFQC